MIAFAFSGQNVHGLVVEMIVDGNFPARLDGKIAQAVFRISSAVVSTLRQPADAGADDVPLRAFERKFFNIYIFFIFKTGNIHAYLLLLETISFS